MSQPPFPTGAALLAGASVPVMLDGPAGPLEAVVDGPDPDAAALPLTVVFCHPLSTEGGSLGNKVVTMACRALRELGATTVRFNFRSVGKSAGAFDEGEGESDDLRCVVDWVRATHPDRALWLGGFSFGAYVSLRCAAELQPGLLISVAPPAGRSWDFDAMALYTGPWVVVQGDADEIVDPDKVYRWIERMGEMRQPPELIRVPDTSHFFHGKLMDLRGAIKAGVRDHLPAATHG